MIKAQIKDLKLLEEFLTVAAKFVQQGQLILTKEKCSLFCKNPQDFSTAKLMLDTNAMYICSNESAEKLKYCIKDITALKTALAIIEQVENINECILEFDNVPINENGDIFAKSVKYTGISKFKLISIDPTVIDKYVTDELHTELTENWSFKINPANLDILQNRTSAIVDVTNDVSIYIYPDTTTKKVMVDLNTRKTDYSNNISLPIADMYIGSLSMKLPEVAIHESSFRLFNILRVKDNIHCFFSTKYNIFFISSEINKELYYIKSRVMCQIIKGK